MKKVMALILALMMSLACLTGCSGGSRQTAKPENTGGGTEPAVSTDGGAAASWPEKDIRVLVGFSAGGTSDLGTRLLFEAAKEDLGVDIIVENITGAGGWNAWSELKKANPDGYTLALVTDPTIYGGYLDPSMNREDSIHDFTPIVNHVSDDACVAVNPSDSRFETFADLIEYARENEVTATTTGVGSQVHLMMLRMNDELGTKFVPVHTTGTADGKTMILGGNVDCFFACVGDIAPSANSGELKCLAVSSEERSEFMPDVPTMVEQGFPLIYAYSARGIIGPAGMDPAVVEKLAGILEKAMASEEHKAAMDQMSLRINFIGHEEYVQMLNDDETLMQSYANLFGWAG